MLLYAQLAGRGCTSLQSWGNRIEPQKQDLRKHLGNFYLRRLVNRPSDQRGW